MEMTIRLIELGPFGCRIDRGHVKDLRDLPVGYEAKRIEDAPDAMIVYIEPKGKDEQ